MNIDLGLSTILTDEVLSPIFLKLDRNITKRVGGWGAIELNQLLGGGGGGGSNWGGGGGGGGGGGAQIGRGRSAQ